MKAIEIPHVRPVQPLDFPDSKPEWELGQSTLHVLLCTLLQAIAHHAFKDRHSIASDAFVYWDASDPEICLAPDLFVKLGVPFEHFRSWKTWERGTPELAVEILSRHNAERLTFKQKLERYRSLGVRELVIYEVEEERIRAWDRIEDDLVERIVGTSTPCLTLELHFVLAPGMGADRTLRLAHDPEGRHLLPTPEEAALHAKRDALRAKEDALREVERLRALLEKKSE